MKQYVFVDGVFEARIEIKRSLFIATVKGEVNEVGAEEFVRQVRKKYPDATHNCYAYVSDEQGNRTRFSDDGEPGGTAGQPILDVLKKQDIVKTAIVVTRYFGGIKLGAGGLHGAYTDAAAAALKVAKTAVKKECRELTAYISYPDYSAVENKLRKFEIGNLDTTFDNGVTLRVYVPDEYAEKLALEIGEITAGRAEVSISDERIFEVVNKTY